MPMGKSGGHAAVFFGVVLASLLIKLFVFDIRLVSGSSMSPALQDGALVADSSWPGVFIFPSGTTIWSDGANPALEMW